VTTSGRTAGSAGAPCSAWRCWARPARPSGAAGSGGAGGAGSTTATTGTTGQGGQGGGEACVVDPQCEETADNPLGPYYRAGAPVTSLLDNPKGTGEALRISGVVFGSDCATPLGGALVEVWQADHDGDYDNQNGDPGPSVWWLRASVVADACGRYAYDTIKPGRYLNGAQYRPSHIHYRVTHPSVAGQFVTQLYFEGDPFNEVDTMYEPSLEIPLVAERGVLLGEFDVVLPI
jgi:catechol 1,2-dioxygenase